MRCSSVLRAAGNFVHTVRLLTTAVDLKALSLNFGYAHRSDLVS